MLRISGSLSTEKAAIMAEASWQQARLIPTSGINGAQEQERRATSALLAVMSSVKEFGRPHTKSLGAHTGEISSFIEVEFDLDGKKLIPMASCVWFAEARPAPRHWSR